MCIFETETETRKMVETETETFIHEYLRLRPRQGKCVFLRPRPGKWSRPRVSLISDCYIGPNE